MSQAEMHELTGISRVTWSNYENGNTEPEIAKLLNIAKAFKVSVDELLNVDLRNKETVEKSNVLNDDAEPFDKDHVYLLSLELLKRISDDTDKIRKKLGI
jgi:transcriptional regulator with XRE-family HTH domain